MVRASLAGRGVLFSPVPASETGGLFSWAPTGHGVQVRELCCSWTVMTGLAALPSAVARRRPSQTVMTALFLADASARLGWTYDGDSDGCLAVGGAILQDPYFGQEKLRLGENPVERASGEGGSGGTHQRHAAHFE